MLEIWRALANFSYRGNSWYRGGRFQSNSVSDAQQLLCLLLPAVSMSDFGLARPDQTDRTALAWLKSLAFANDFEQVATREDLQLEVARLRERAGRRLTAAMVGLLRSFTINAFDADSRPGQALLRTVNQATLPERRVIDDLRAALAPVAAGLGDISIGSGQKKDLTGVNMLFELGWSWGVIHVTPVIEFAEAAGKQPEGLAADEPYMYFTMAALNSIADLFTAQSLRTDLLDPDQARLARALENRWKTTQLYWSIIASFGGGRRWPLQDVPWRSTDEVESGYLTILVAGAANA